MRLAGGFNAKIFILLACLICLWSLLMTLGFWQLHRAAEKEALLEISEQKMKAEPVALDASRRDYTDLRYQRVHAAGRFLRHQQFLLDNQVNKGRVGYHVLTPFVLEETGRVVLVDRGWVQASPDRRLLPDVSVTDEPLRLTGSLYVPYGAGYSLGVVMDDTVSWPRVIQVVDWELMSQAMDIPLAPVMLRMDRLWDDGLEHEWVLVPFGPEKHLGYAIQWFAMAVVLLIMTAVFYRSRSSSE